jgi:hypothetical protein
LQKHAAYRQPVQFFRAGIAACAAQGVQTGAKLWILASQLQAHDCAVEVVGVQAAASVSLKNAPFGVGPLQ